MKKVLAIVLALAMLFSFAACGTEEGGDVTEYTGKVVVYSPHDADPLNAA